MRLLVVVVAIALTACTEVARQAPEPPATTGAEEMLRATRVFVYPSQGQNAEQLDRDRYECYRWSVAQTGFDPSQAALAPHQRVEVVAATEPGSATAAGAITGAAVGAVVSNPRHSAEGAIVGAVIGGLAGAASDAEQSQQAEELRRRYDERESAWFERQSNEYRRALSACLEGRGYTVK